MRPNVARPRASPGECRVTWIGQSSFLLQIGQTTILTDPVLSRRAGPFKSVGPARFIDATISLADLPAVDAVVLSHDHYDHLDSRTVRGLVERLGSALPFITPLGYKRWFARQGAHNVVERDWWETAELPGITAEFVCLPAQHWTRRGLNIGRRLWSSWMIRAAPFAVYFCGDSGYCPAFREIGARLSAPDIALMPIGAYAPRWFMKPAHMDPDEAVQAFLELGARDFVAMHWGTFRLTDEPMLEPPVKTRVAWEARQLPLARLHVPRHGETLIWRAERGRAIIAEP